MGACRALKLFIFTVYTAMITISHQESYSDYLESEFESSTPCNELCSIYPDFDIINLFSLDELQSINNGVQTYHLQWNSNMTLPSWEVFPNGLPNEFSFEYILRMTQPHGVWYLFDLNNFRNERQMSLSINSNFQTIDFSLLKEDGSLETISFINSAIFNKSWHKLMLSVTQNSVRIWVDCEEVIDSSGNWHLPRGSIDVTRGTFSLAQNYAKGVTEPIEVQALIFSCNAERPTYITCQELPRENLDLPPNPVSSTTWPTPLDDIIRFEEPTSYRPWVPSSTPLASTHSETVCPQQCPPGMPGLPGLPGIPGADAPVLKGEKGEPGSPGLPGTTTIIREQVESSRGDLKPNSETIVHMPSSEYEQITVKEVRDICMGIVREYVNAYASGAPGARGPPGKPGPIGPTGLRGVPGRPGLAGMRGHKGPPGNEGPRGHSGEDGQKGERGTDGIEGGQGPIGPSGVCREVEIEGLPGRNGDPGSPGLPGPSGPQGSPGVCPECPDLSAHYMYPLLMAQQQQQYSNKGPRNYYNNKGP